MMAGHPSGQGRQDDERDPGWAYTQPNRPPVDCRCGEKLILINGVACCRSCDFMGNWPNFQKAGL